MAKISASKGWSDENSGYTRLIGNQELGHVMSQVQAAVIRTGNELEKILAERTSRPRVSLMHLLGSIHAEHEEVEIVFDPQLAFLNEPGVRADILIANHQNRTCRVIELKDGDTFDTKKSNGELSSLKRFAAEISRILGYSATYHFCSFNQPNKLNIIKGAKGRFTLDEVMTGGELCELLGVSFEAIVEYRILEQQENLAYLLDRLLAIDEVRKGILERLNADLEK